MNTTKAAMLLSEFGVPPHTTRAVRQKASRLVARALKSNSVDAVAKMLGVGKSTAWRWGEGTLPHALYVPIILKVLKPKAAVTP